VEIQATVRRALADHEPGMLLNRTVAHELSAYRLKKSRCILSGLSCTGRGHSSYPLASWVRATLNLTDRSK